MADAGMKLVLTARRKQVLEKIAAQIDTEVAIMAGDIIDESLPQKLIDTAVERFGSCDVVFNNAGVMIVGKAEDIDLEAVCRMGRINVEAVYRLAIVAMRHLISQGSGYLINTSSILGMKVRETTGSYAGTKYAVEALTEDLRMQASGTGVRVCALEPGLVDTHLQDHFPVHPKDMLDIKVPVAYFLVFISFSGSDSHLIKVNNDPFYPIHPTYWTKHPHKLNCGTIWTGNDPLVFF